MEERVRHGQSDEVIRLVGVMEEEILLLALDRRLIALLSNRRP
jgi:hypothetical protein